MTAIVITTATWHADYCPRCGLGPYGKCSRVTWHTHLRGMCEAGHFVALQPNAVEKLLSDIFGGHDD